MKSQSSLVVGPKDKIYHSKRIDDAVLLYDILEIVGKKYAVINPEIEAFY